MDLISIEQTQLNLKRFDNIKELINGINCNEKLITHNYIEISGYPHYENVVSNILSFFFDTNEEHQFNDLFIKSLLNIYCRKTKKHINIDKFTMYTNTQREYPTPSGGRLDILISGNYLIGIENKINADLYNDLQDYYSALIQYKNMHIDNRIDDIVPVVLSLYEIKIENDNFINITYKEFIDSINQHIGDYIFDGDNKWLLFYKEFAINILSLVGEEKMENIINFDFNKYLSNNKSVMTKFYELVEEDIENKRIILNEIRKLIIKYEFSMYQSQHSNFKSLYYLIDKNIKVEILIFLNEIYINVWQTSGDGSKLNNIINSIQNEYNYSFEKSDKWWQYAYIIDKKDLLDDFDLKSFASVVENWCDIVKRVIVSVDN